MTADYRDQAIEDPSAVLQELYRAYAASSTGFPAYVAEHFSKLFETTATFRKIPTLSTRCPFERHRDGALVRFRGMVQDTSLSTEMYLAKHSDGSPGGWGMYEADGGSSSGAANVDYSNLQECTVLWATSVPAESPWCADELDDHSSDEVSVGASSVQRSHKYPHPDSPHVGVQVKIYDKAGTETYKSTDVVTFVGILSAEPCGLEHSQEVPSEVPTLHVLFAKRHSPTVVSRSFPRLVRQPHDAQSGVRLEPTGTAATDSAQVREELITWIAEEALGGDRQAAEWVLFASIARVQSRHPPLFPSALLISHFPPPPSVPSSSEPSAALLVPTLSAILSLLLPLTHTLPLSLEGLNKAKYTPESKEEDLHAGVLQMPQGTVLLVSEGGVSEGQLLERGVMNVRALQEVMDAQTLAYVFPFSQFSFPTDISCVILAEGRKSAFFKTELNIPLRARTDTVGVAALYKPADQVKLPSPERLEAFRDLVVGARCGKVVVPEAMSEHIQAEFVRQRQGDRSVTADDLILWMNVAKSYALSMHETTLSVEGWQYARSLDDQRRALLT